MNDDQLAERLAQALGALANTVGGQALDMDPNTATKLREMAGSVVEIQCLQPPMAWHITVGVSSLTVATGEHEAPHAIVAGSPADLVGWLFGSASKNLQISGDDTLLAELVEIAKAYSPDFTAPLGAMFGPGLAQTLMGTAELGLSSLVSLFEGIGESIKDHGQAHFVGDNQFDKFLNQVDELRLRVDRLAARINEHESGRSGSGQPQ